MPLSLLHTFPFSCLLGWFWATLRVLLIIKVLKKKGWGLEYAFSVFVVTLYGFCLRIVYIAHLSHPYQRVLVHKRSLVSSINA